MVQIGNLTGRTIVAGAIALATIGVSDAFTQSIRQTLPDIRILGIEGPDTVSVGDVETYRAKLNDYRQVEFRWATDEYTALGNPIVHRFQRPGVFDITLTARNTRSTADHTFRITVLGDEPPPPPVAATTPPATRNQVPVRVMVARQLRRPALEADTVTARYHIRTIWVANRTRTESRLHQRLGPASAEVVE